MIDLLVGAEWECGATTPGSAAEPTDLETQPVTWLPANVPGTAAGALRAVGSADAEDRRYDDQDWWFRCRFAGESGSWHLCLEGIATVADVWLNGVLVAHGENMFRSVSATDLQLAKDNNELVICCRGLDPLLDRRFPRPRWKSYLVTHQNLRWFRTTLLGRLPGWAVTPQPAGPWRPVRLTPSDGFAPSERRVVARVDGADGIVEVSFRLPRCFEDVDALLEVGGVTTTLDAERDDKGVVLSGEVRVPNAELWWPHTHGSQTRYEVEAVVGTQRVRLGLVGFRTIELDRAEDSFTFVVNGSRIFCRGACWMPPDPVSMAAPLAASRRLVELARSAHMNMLRVPATTVYESEDFFGLCDELGILVWQDCAFAFLDPPDDDRFREEVTLELTEAFSAMSGHPSLAVICGGQEVEEVAAMTGIAREKWHVPLLESLIPAIVESVLPDTPYVTSNPTGGDMPFQMDAGVSQYFGVGGYLRPPEDARRSGVRFAAECLAFANPPERETVEACGGAYLAGHDPGWKRAVHHDAGRSWDMEDVRDFYLHELFGLDPLRERYVDAERALDLARATNAELMSLVFSEWRRPNSSCSGGLVLALNDLRLGAGWGVVDTLGRPKAPYFALRRTFRALGLLLIDEGLNGLRCWIVNDKHTEFSGAIRVELFARGELVVDQGQIDVTVGAHSGVEIDAGSLLDGFRDITYAYRFAPPAHDVVVATLLSVDGEPICDTVFLPLGQNRVREPDIGLSATVLRGSPTEPWTIDVSTRRFGQWVSVEVPSFEPEDSWFHLPPGRSRTIRLRDLGEASVPRGIVRALNSEAVAHFRPSDG